VNIGQMSVGCELNEPGGHSMGVLNWMAHQSDSSAMMKVLIDLQKNDLLPTELVADTAYGADDNFCLCKRYAVSIP
jgi:hypothetical protein